MSPSGQMPYNHSQSRPSRIYHQQAPLPQPQSYNNLYGHPFSGFYAPFGAGRQSLTHPGFRTPFNMPGVSQLTNSALVDALLAPSANEQEQEQEHRAPPYSTSIHESRTLPKRSRRSGDICTDESDIDEHESSAEAGRQGKDTFEKRSKKQRRRNGVAQQATDDEYVDTAHLSSFDSPVRTRKSRRSSRPKKSPALAGFLTPEEDDDPLSPPKQQKRKNAATARKQRQPVVGRLIRKKPIGIAVPKSLAEAGPADRMMWTWKNQGRNWEEIRTEWKRITGHEPGGSSLSVRYIKLLENLARNGAASDIELLRFKREVEEELLSQVWEKVAEKMLAYSAESEHNPKDLQKRYNMIVRSGYDVEKLLEDDRLKRESEQKGNAIRNPAAHHTQYAGDFGVDIGAMSSYHNSATNETANRVGEQESGDVDHVHIHAYQSDIPAASAAPTTPTDVFESVRALQDQVDGLNDQAYMPDVKYNLENDHGVDTAMPTYTLPSNNLFISPRPSNNHLSEVCLPPANLVNYDSDSE